MQRRFTLKALTAAGALFIRPETRDAPRRSYFFDVAEQLVHRHRSDHDQAGKKMISTTVEMPPLAEIVCLS